MGWHAPAPFVFHTGAGSCRLLQVILHRVQGCRHVFVGKLLWILRG